MSTNDEKRLTLSPSLPRCDATSLIAFPTQGFGFVASDAPLITGSVRSGVLLNNPFTALASVEKPEAGFGLGERRPRERLLSSPGTSSDAVDSFRLRLALVDMLWSMMSDKLCLAPLLHVLSKLLSIEIEKVNLRSGLSSLLNEWESGSEVADTV